MILTSYMDKLCFLTSRLGHVASIQTMSHDKLKEQVSQQFLSRNITFMSYWNLWNTMTGIQVNAAIDELFCLTTCEVLRHTSFFFLYLYWSGKL